MSGCGQGSPITCLKIEAQRSCLNAAASNWAESIAQSSRSLKTLLDAIRSRISFRIRGVPERRSFGDCYRHPIRLPAIRWGRSGAGFAGACAIGGSERLMSDTVRSRGLKRETIIPVRLGLRSFLLPSTKGGIVHVAGSLWTPLPSARRNRRCKTYRASPAQQNPASLPLPLDCG